MAQYRALIQDHIKTTTEGFSVYLLKILSGLFLALTASLILQEIIGFQTLSFVLLASSLMLGFMRVARSWGLGTLLVFDLICILIALLLRMYILIAPGA